MGTILHPGFLYWDGLKYITTGGSSLASGPAGGDLSGTYPNPIVSGLQNHPVSNTAPTNGQVLTWVSVSDQWVPTTFTTTLAGDVTGPIGSNTVTKLQGNPVEAQSSGSLTTGFVLTWNGTSWVGQEPSLVGEAASGDLGDFYPNPTVRKIWGAYAPQAGAGVPPGYTYSGSSFAIGNPLQVINTGIGTQALGYAPLNLSGGTNVSGQLPTANQASQTLGGDLSGVTSSANIVALRGNPLQYNILGGNPAYDGYVLTWSYTNNQWRAEPSVTGSSLAGDVIGSFASNSISKLQGVPLSATGPAGGQVIQYSSFDGAYINGFLFVNLEGDLSGSWTSGTSTLNATIQNIKGKPLDSTLSTIGAAQDGYALIWNNEGPYWEALPSGEGSGGVQIGGDIGNIPADPIVIGIQGNPVSNVSPIDNQVLVENNVGTGSHWAYIVDANVALDAGIEGGKIVPNFDTQVTCPSEICTGTVTSAYFSFGYSVVSPAPYLVAGSAVPTGTPGFPNGTIFVNINGPADGYQSLYMAAADTWVSIGASAAGLAGGDLSGNYPNPTVAAINGKTVNYDLGLGPGFDGTAWILTWDHVNSWWHAKENDVYTVEFTENLDGEGDLTGFFPNPTVARVQQNNVENVQYGSNPIYDGYVMTWIHSTEEWQAKPLSELSGAAGGDLSGDYPNPSVAKINGVSVSGFPSANTVLVATSGSASTWEQISDAEISSLAAIAVSKLAPGTSGQILINNATPLPSWKTVSGDVGISNTGVTTLNNIQGKTVSTSLASIGSSQDGYALTWDNTDGYWKALPSAGGSFAPGGDLGGDSIHQIVESIQGVVISGTPSAGEVLLATSSTAAHWAFITNINGASVPAAGSLTNGNVLQVNGPSSLTYAPINVGGGTNYITGTLPNSNQQAQNMGGDVSGTTAAATVIKLQGNPITSQSLGAFQDGYVLTWDNTDGYWKAEETASGTFSAGGDLSGSSDFQTVIAINGTSVPATPSANQVLVATGSASAVWEQISNAQIASAAGISYSKLTLTGDIVNSDISASAAIAVNKLATGSSAEFLLMNGSTPTWTAMSGDVSVSAAGATTVNKIQGVAISGTPSNGQILIATSSSAADWQNAPTGSFSAGGDLSGSSTDQTVVGLQTVPVSNTPPMDGYVLTYIAASSNWEPRAPTGGGGGGGELGKVIFTTTTVTSNYVIDSEENDYYIFCSQSAPINVTLPDPFNGRTVVIKDISNNAFTNNITVLQFGSESIDGVAGSFVISSNLGSATFAADASGNWWIV